MKLPEDLQTLPIILASTHGLYNVDPPLRKFKVPPNVFIFEACSICETIYNSMDKPLWTLIAGENRDMFLKYFTNSEEATYEQYTKVFQNLHFYKPGDEIYERKLSFVGGRENRGMFPPLGFFHFPIDSKMPNMSTKSISKSSIRLLEPLRKHLIEKANVWNETTNIEDVHITNEDFIQKHIFPIMPETEKGAIFIFSSCAGVECTGTTRNENQECDNNVYEIERHQHAQDLQALELGLACPLSGDSKPNMEFPRRIYQRRGKIGQSFAPTRKNTKNEDPYYGENAHRRQAWNRVTKSNRPAPKHTDTIVYAVELPDPADPPKVLDPEKIVGKIYSVATPAGNPYFTEKGLASLQKKGEAYYKKYPKFRLYKVKGKQYVLLD